MEQVEYTKVIFVCRDNLLMSPVAAAILDNWKRDAWLEVESRGLVVLFPEPYHSKAYSLLQNNGIILPNGTAQELLESDFGPQTLILTMSKEEKQQVLDDYRNAQNVYTVMEFAGGSGNIMDPYGGDSEIYAMFFASISNWVRQVEAALNADNDISPDESDKADLDVKQD